jgi:hypothetical protein
MMSPEQYRMWEDAVRVMNQMEIVELLRIVSSECKRRTAALDGAAAALIAVRIRPAGRGDTG